MADTFDLQSALKEASPEEVANYLAQQHGIDRNAYLKEGLSDQEFLNEYGSKPLPGAAPQSAVTVQAAEPESKTAGAILGAGAGLPVAAGFGSKGAYDFAKELASMRAATAAPAAAPIPSPSAAPSVVSEHGFHTGAATNAEFNEQQRLANELKSKLHATPEPGFQVEGNRRILTPVGSTAESASKEKAAMKLAREVEAAKHTPLGKAKDIASKAAHLITPGGMAGKIVNTAVPVLGLAGAGAEAVDAYNRAKHGDYGRAVISGLGALGSAATVVPHPLVRGIGTAASLGAPVVNMALDKMLGREGYAQGGLVYLSTGGTVTKDELELLGALRNHFR